MLNEFGTPIGVECESMLPPGQNKPHQRMLAESGIEMQWLGVAVAGLSMASSWMGAQKQADNQQRAADRQAAEQRRQFSNQAAQNAYNTEFSRLMIAEHNNRTEEIYDKKLDQYREQVTINAESALGAWAQEQRVINEQWGNIMITKQKMLRELMEIQGNQLAAGQGNTNKSLERANLINSLGNYGMEQHMLDEQLRGANIAYREKVNSIGAQWAHADRDAFSQVAIAPSLMLPETGAGPQLQGPGPAARISGPGFGTFLGAVAGGLQAGQAIHTAAGFSGSFLSDVSLKENIVHVGKSPSGINIFEYNYQGETTRHQGAMAQEVLVKKPEAVVEMDNGYLGINYDMIDVDMKKVPHGTMTYG